MQEMMNDTAELTREENNGDNLPVVLNEEVQPEEQEKSELDKQITWSMDERGTLSATIE